MRSLNQIIAELEAFANVHYQIHTFGHGDIWEATPNSSEIVYPILWLVPTGATTGLREVTTNFTVICMDLVRSGEENETEVLSDTLQIILDVVSYYRQQHNQTYIVEFGSNIQPFTESHPDMLAGHSITVSIRQPFAYNECAIPFSGAPTPLVPSCADATIQNAASNPTYQASIESGGNLVLPQVKVLDSDGVTDILANYIPSADGYVAQCSVPTCENAIVTNQTGDWEEDIPSGDTWPLPYGKVKDKDGNDVQVDYRPASEGYIFEETACPAGGGSISVAVSDASPSVGDTITITATPSDFTPDSYIFFAHNDTTNELTFIAEQASNTFDWEVLGVVGDNTVYVLGVENGSPDITAFGTVNITVASSYLIDLPYGSNINASFSFVRRSAAYNDYVTLIRRSSDNAQEYFKLSANDVLDLTSENVAGTTTLGTWIGVDDGFLVTWKEQVSGITATNNIAASQAKIASAGSIITQNGVPAPTEVAWGAYTLSTPVLAESLFVIAKNDSISNAVQYPVGGNSSGIVFGGTVTEVTGISVIASGFYASHVEDVFIHLVSAIPSASLHIDGNLESAISLSPIVVRTIGTRPDNWGLAMDGKIMEVIFSSVAETVNRSDIESNINNSYTPSIF